MLDFLILLAPGGYICYHGEASQAVSYFTRLGFPCPEQTNPAEFLLDLVSVDSEDAYQTRKDELRINRLATSFAESQRSYEKTALNLATYAMKAIDFNATGYSPSEKNAQCFRTMRRFGHLLRRSLRQNIRNHALNIFRLFLSIGSAFLFSQIFHSIKKGIITERSISDRIAVLSFSVINISMMALMKTIDLFAKEKPVVHRERHRNQYTS